MISLHEREKPFWFEGDEVYVSVAGHVYTKDRRGRLNKDQGRVFVSPSIMGRGGLTALGEAILAGDLPGKVEA